MKRFLIVILLITAVALPAGGARAGTPDERLQAHINQGFYHVYSLEYDQAGKEFQKLIDRAPDDPAGYCYQAINLWLRELLRGRELALENFTSAAYFSKAQPRPLDPGVDQQFRNYVQRAIEKATALLQKNPKDTRALYYLGTAHGTMGTFEMTIYRKKVAALRSANKAVDYQRQVLKLDPQHYDAYLTVGLYEYITGKLPWTIRWLIRIAGYRGNVQKGLEQLRMAAEKGHYNRNDARIILAVLYVWETQAEKSLELMQGLHQQFPKNYLLELDSGALCRFLKKDDQAAQVYQDILRKVEARVPHYDQLGAEQVHYRLGSLYLDNKNVAPAVEHLGRAVQLAKGQGEVATLAHLKLGQAYDLARQRGRAEEQYKIVLQREDVRHSQDAARRYLRRPYAGLND